MYGKRNCVSRSRKFSKKIEMGSAARTWEIDPVSDAGEKIGLNKE